MKPLKFSGQFRSLYTLAVLLARSEEADAIVILLEGPTDWDELRSLASEEKVIVVADTADELEGAAEAGLTRLVVDMPQSPVYDKLGQALLEAVADELLKPGARVVTLYSGFDARSVDSMSVISLSDHLGRLTVRDLQQLETTVPLDTLQTVINLAVDIGREGREGKPVGTMFVVGDQAKVLKTSHPQGFDPVKGYSRKERNLKSARVREAVKEIAQMDGAFVVAADGTVEAACRYIDAPAADITLSKGLGARHWAAAAVSRATKAIAVTVSESTGTVRVFDDGEVKLRIEPLRRPMKWKEFEFEPPEPGREKEYPRDKEREKQRRESPPGADRD
jgi:DNA integrity scanning protein DisA with diadenylate cyclase activity